MVPPCIYGGPPGPSPSHLNRVKQSHCLTIDLITNLQHIHTGFTQLLMVAIHINIYEWLTVKSITLSAKKGS